MGKETDGHDVRSLLTLATINHMPRGWALLSEGRG
jgi:hypothetical protein